MTSEEIEHDKPDTITALRAENERLTKTSEAAKENRDSLLKEMIAKDAEVERLRNLNASLAHELREAAEKYDEHLDEIERLRAALHRISLGSQNSGTTKEDLGREARATLGGTDA